MINSNGLLVESKDALTLNRAFLYGDAVFETIKVVGNTLLFFEDHYFRLMSSMRIVRMTIPMTFTMEYLEEEIIKTLKANQTDSAARVRITVFRNGGGLYLPKDNNVSFHISCSTLDSKSYQLNESPYEVELFKDFYITKQLLSSIKTTNKMINVVGSIFASENGYQNCLLMNDSKTIVEALNGNLFMRFGNKVVTPPISEGCLNGVMRKQVIAILNQMEGIEFSEQIISPFDLQKSDELFTTNVIIGIQPITKYRKKEFVNTISKKVLVELNLIINSN